MLHVTMNFAYVWLAVSLLMLCQTSANTDGLVLSEEEWLKLSSDIEGEAGHDHFGQSVDLSSDGTMLHAIMMRLGTPEYSSGPVEYGPR